MTIKDKKSKAIIFCKGTVNVNFKNKYFTMEFNGEGGPTFDNSTTYPISGSVNINIKKKYYESLEINNNYDLHAFCNYYQFCSINS